MQTFKLSNGMTVLFEKNSSQSVAVQVMVKVGSNDEKPAEAGLSHFLEHMLFEGTKKRANSQVIANEIEQYGAEFNAYTTGDRTAYYIKIMNKKFGVALDILSDMLLHSVFDPKMIAKEQKVVLKEINMVTDDPRQHMWVLFQQQLFSKHQAKNPTYGTVKAVKSFNRATVKRYFEKHYVPSNMIISISGNVSNVKQLCEQYFGSKEKKKPVARVRAKEPTQNKAKKFVQSRKMQSSYMVLGYKTVSRTHPDSYVLDVILGILGRGQSGWMFNEIRNKRGLAYQVGVQVEAELDHGYFAVYAGLDKKYIEMARKIMLEQFEKVAACSAQDVSESKTFIEGHYSLQMEDNFHTADTQAYYHTIKDAKLAKEFISKIKKVTLNDVHRVAKKYLNDKYTLVCLQQK